MHHSAAKTHTCVNSWAGTIPSDQLQYEKVPFWNNMQIPLSKHSWKLKIIAIWLEHQGQGLPQCSQQRLAKRSSFFSTKLVHTRRALSSTVINSHQEPVSGQACNPPDPHLFSFSRWRSFTVLSGTKVAPFP
jgi:hypothetical protein